MLGKHGTIGVKGLSYAGATVNESTKEVTYELPKLIPDVQEIGIDIKTKTIEVRADDDYETDEIIEEIDVTINVAGISNAILTDLGGHSVDANGVMIEKRSDKPKYVAIGFEGKKKNEEVRYVWLLLGKKAPTNTKYKTLEDEKGEVILLTFKFKPRGSDGHIKYTIDSDDTSAPVDLDSKWLSKVYDGTWV